MIKELSDTMPPHISLVIIDSDNTSRAAMETMLKPFGETVRVMASVADMVLFPMQDVLGLGCDARMNTPSTASGNWRWRAHSDALRADTAARLREMVEAYERRPTD